MCFAHWGSWFCSIADQAKEFWYNTKKAFIENYQRNKNSTGCTYYWAPHLKFVIPFIKPDNNIYRALRNARQQVNKIQLKVEALKRMAPYWFKYVAYNGGFKCQQKRVFLKKDDLWGLNKKKFIKKFAGVEGTYFLLVTSLLLDV